jgi:hypothetical protein
VFRSGLDGTFLPLPFAISERKSKEVQSCAVRIKRIAWTLGCSCSNRGMSTLHHYFQALTAISPLSIRRSFGYMRRGTHAHGWPGRRKIVLPVSLRGQCRQRLVFYRVDSKSSIGFPSGSSI